MTFPRISSVRPNELSSPSDQTAPVEPIRQASSNPVLTVKEHALAVDDILHCLPIDGQCSGTSNGVHVSDNRTAISKYRTPSTAHRATLGVKDGATSKGYSSVSQKPMRVEANKAHHIENKQIPECSMCGDVGLRKQLFRCGKCHHRLQHTYCSNWYPKKRSYAGICNWCDTEVETRKQQKQQTEDDRSITSQSKIEAIAHFDNSKTKQRSWKKTRTAGIGSSARNPWKNDLEMLHEAATIIRDGALESKVGNEIAKFTGLIKSGPNPQTDRRSDHAHVDGIKCKEPSSLARKIGRRYKFVVDVY